MPLTYPLVHIDDVAPERMNAGEGWAISEFRLPITKKEGSSTTAFHSRFRAGSSHKKHLHTDAEEYVYYIRGGGVAGAGEGRIEMRTGSFRLNPLNVEHWYWNQGGEELVEVVGFYTGAGSVEETGYVYKGEVTEEDVTRAAGPYAHPAGNVADVPPEEMDEGQGWRISEFRLLLSAREGCASTLFHARFMPGAVHKKHLHENCDEIYYIISGHGLAGAGPDRVEV
ncbi:MAG: hypothetical protein V3V62_03075, partial [bacterium]